MSNLKLRLKLRPKRKSRFQNNLKAIIEIWNPERMRHPDFLKWCELREAKLIKLGLFKEEDSCGI